MAMPKFTPTLIKFICNPNVKPNKHYCFFNAPRNKTESGSKVLKIPISIKMQDS